MTQNQKRKISRITLYWSFFLAFNNFVGLSSKLMVMLLKITKKGDPMGTFDTKINFLALFLCAVFFLQNLNGMPPQELYLEPSQPYAIACFLSFFIGAILCGLIHRYCVQPPIIQPEKPKEPNEEKKKLFDSLNIKIETLQTKQDEMVSVITEQKKITDQLLSVCNGTTFLCMCSLISLAHMKMMYPDKNRYANTTQSNFLPNFVAARYWKNKYENQKKLNLELEKNVILPKIHTPKNGHSQNNSLTN